jgi:hypothetical protein
MVTHAAKREAVAHLQIAYEVSVFGDWSRSHLGSRKTTTALSDRTATLAISRRPLTPIAMLPTRNGTGRCAAPGAPRPVPLLHRAKWAQINLGLCSSLDETRGSGHSLPP